MQPRSQQVHQPLLQQTSNSTTNAAGGFVDGGALGRRDGNHGKPSAAEKCPTALGGGSDVSGLESVRTHACGYCIYI